MAGTVITAGTYAVCFSTDSGTTFFPQSISLNFADAPDAPASAAQVSVTASTITVNITQPADVQYATLFFQLNFHI